MAEEHPEISVIVPVYNGEKYLPETLDSILAQTFEDFELICVDDGSTDGTVDILEAYAKKDGRIRIVRQQNQYAGIARNNGIRNAGGKWLLCLDADDFFSPELLEKMHDKAQQDDADICVAGVYYYHEAYDKYKPGKEFAAKQFIPEKCPFSKKDIGDYIFNFTTMHVWNKLFKMQFIREYGLEFPECRVSEDAVFTFFSLLFAERITVLDEKLIYYRVGTGKSVTDQVSKDILTGYNVYREVKDTMIYAGIYSDGIRKSFANKALGTSIHIFRNAATLESYIRLYNKLAVEGGFENLDVRPDAEYYDKNHQEKLHKMLECQDPYEYLFWQYKDELKAKDKLSYENAELKRKLKSEQKKNEKIRKSYTFKLGKAMLWFPNKLKKVFS